MVPKAFMEYCTIQTLRKWLRLVPRHTVGGMLGPRCLTPVTSLG